MNLDTVFGQRQNEWNTIFTFPGEKLLFVLWYVWRIHVASMKSDNLLYIMGIQLLDLYIAMKCKKNPVPNTIN